MDRERAETYLRQLAETELRRATTPGGRDAHRAGSLHLVAYTLMTVGAIDVDTLDEVQAELELAEAMRWPAEGRAAALRRARLTWVRPRRDATGPSAASRQPPWRVVPVGQVIGIRDEVRGELGLLAYLQTAHGGRFTMAGWMHGPAPDPQWPLPGRPFSRQFTAVDDQGTVYTVRFSTRMAGSAVLSGVLDLSPDPRREIRWLDLRTAPDAPAVRISLEQRSPEPGITVTEKAVSPGELLADVIAARVLALASDFPQETPGQLAAAKPGLLPHLTSWLGDLVAALQAADVLAPSSPVPGQLAGLCARLGVTGHGIATPPGTDLPERWLSMLTRYHRRTPRPAPAPGSWVAAAVRLPELDGVRLAVLGLHHDEDRTVLHLHTGGGTMEDDWAYYRAVRPLPALWVRDSASRWHATRDYVPRFHGDGEATLDLTIVPPLEAGTESIDVVATGQSAEVRVRLPVRWSWHP
jgi:hypothetical protein